MRGKSMAAGVPAATVACCAHARYTIVRARSSGIYRAFCASGCGAEPVAVGASLRQVRRATYAHLRGCPRSTWLPVRSWPQPAMAAALRRAGLVA